MTIARQQPPAGYFADRLTTRELDVLIAKLRAGWATANAVYPAIIDPLWRDTVDLLGDLHGAWVRAFAREGEAAP